MMVLFFFISDWCKLFFKAASEDERAFVLNDVFFDHMKSVIGTDFEWIIVDSNITTCEQGSLFCQRLKLLDRKLMERQKSYCR